MRGLNLAISIVGIATVLSCSDRVHLEKRNGSGNEYKITRFDGEKDLVRMSRDVDSREESFVFKDSIFYDIGIEERLDTVSVDTILLRKIISSSKAGDTIYLYHCHPKSRKGIGLNAPSDNDIMNYASLSYIYRNHHVNIKTKVSDSKGMWEYSIIKDSLDKILQSDKAADAWSKSLSFEINLQDYVMRRFYKDIGQEKSVGKYILGLRRAGVELKYISYDEIGK